MSSFSLMRVASPSLRKGLLASLFGVGIGFFLHAEGTLDRLLQEPLYVRSEGHWRIDDQDPFLRELFYRAPKIALAAVSSALLFAWLFSLLSKPTHRTAERRDFQARAGLSLCCLMSGVLLVAYLKHLTHQPCPYQLAEYGGRLGSPSDRQCYPAGHASAGFAWMSLAFFARTRKGAALVLAAGCACGWILGLFQMMKGAHFFSHTLTTQFLQLTLVFSAALIYRSIHARSIHTHPLPRTRALDRTTP